MARQQRQRQCLLIVDVFNDFRFEGGDALARHALGALPALVRLRDWCDATARPVLYCNDNYRHWHSSFEAVIEQCRDASPAAVQIVDQLRPRRSDYTVLKPRHSAFHATPLDLLLQELEADSVLIAGIASDSCVLATAIDAKCRGHCTVVVEDACAAQSTARHRRAMTLLETACIADVVRSDELLVDQVPLDRTPCRSGSGARNDVK